MAAKSSYFTGLQTGKREFAMQHKMQRPKIQKVHETLMKDEKQSELYYKPKVISFGPIHHHLELGKSKKFMWAAAYMEEHGSGSENAEQLRQKIAENIVQLKELYTKDVIEGYSDEELAWMLLVDGCAMLYLLKSIADLDLEKFQTADLSLVLKDLLLLENQLPYELLNLLTNSSEWLMKSMGAFCEAINPMPKRKTPRNDRHSPEQSNNVGGPQQEIPIEEAEDDPVHLLDHMRKLILGRPSLRNNGAESGGCMDFVKSCRDHCLPWKKPIPDEAARNIQNLKEEGILRVKRDDDATLRDISFHSGAFAGYLHMPPVAIGNRAALLFQNLKAYELCPDFDNKFEICSFILFINLLVNCEEDVKQLRSARVLLTQTGTDTEVVEIISNLISDDLVFFVSPFLQKILYEMNAYFRGEYRSKFMKWVAEANYKYFRSPWTIIACIAAAIGLLLTFISTVQGFKSLSG